MSNLFAWVIAASSMLAPDRDHDKLATAIASRAEAETPLFVDDGNRRKTSALLVAIAFRESSLRADAVGDHRAGKPTSFCAFQIHLGWAGAKTAEGFTADELVTDPEKCVTAAMQMIRESMRACPAHPLAFYASGPAGCDNLRAQRISRDRLAMARRLVRDVPLPIEVEDRTRTPPLPASPPISENPEPLPTPPRERCVAIDPTEDFPRHFCGGA